MHVYAHCRNCGHDFESDEVVLESAVGITLDGVAVDCPRCGHPANAMDGVFDFDPTGALDIVSAPAWSRALIYRMTPAQARRIRNGAVWAKETLGAEPEREQEVETKLLALIAREAPWLAEFVDRALSSRTASILGIVSFVFMLLTFFGLDAAAQHDPQPTVVVVSDEQLEQMLDEYLERQRQDDEQPRPAPTTKGPTPPAPPTTGK